MLKGDIVYRVESVYQNEAANVRPWAVAAVDAGRTWRPFRWRVIAAGHRLIRLERIDPHPWDKALQRMQCDRRSFNDCRTLARFCPEPEQAWEALEVETIEESQKLRRQGLRHEGAEDALEAIRAARGEWKAAQQPPDDEHAAVESHTCPLCKQEPGDLCITLGAGKLRGRAHEPRIELARRARRAP